jgi:hypothetical protein
MIAFVLNNLLVGLSSFLWARAFYFRKTFADFILTWFLFFFAQIILVELLLGIAGRLVLADIFILHLIILSIAAYFFKRNSPYPAFYRIEAGFIFRSKILLISAAVFCGFFLVALWINLINPPYGADSHIYHLAYPATWIRMADLFSPPVVFGNIVSNSTPYFPINAELFFFWLMLPLRSAFLADTAEVPFYMIAVLAIYSILRKFGVRPAVALFSGFIWALIPNVFKQIEQGSYVDVICAAFFLLSMNFILAMSREKLDLKNALLCGISLGLFLGIKRLNIFWSLGLAPLFLYIFIRAKEKIPLKAVSLALIFLGVFIFGGYSYLKSFLLTGNCLYPVKVSLFGRTIMPGYLNADTVGNYYYPWKDFNLKNFFFSEGLGLQLICFVIPGTVLPLAALLFKRQRAAYAPESFFIFIIPAFMLAVFLFCIKAYWIRYLFPYLAVGIIALVIFLSRFRFADRYIYFFGFASTLSSSGEICGYWRLAASYIFSILIFLFFYFWFRFSKNVKLGVKIFFTAFSILFVLTGLWFLDNKYNREEFARYERFFVGKESQDRELALGWKWMNERSGEGARIAYTGRPTFYPLFGTRLKNDVFYVSVNDKPGLPHYYPDGLIRKVKSFGSWKENLQRHSVDYLFIALPVPDDNESDRPEEFPIEDKWAQENPGLFQLIFTNSKVRIYVFMGKRVI